MSLVESVPRGTMCTETCLQTRQLQIPGPLSATLSADATGSLQGASSSITTVGENMSSQGSELPDRLYLAEWGRPESVWIYNVENSFLDADAITQSLFYGLEDKELLLYDSPFADPYKPLERCPIVNGRAEITNVHALKGKGLHYTCPLGVLTGSMFDLEAYQKLC